MRVRNLIHPGALPGLILLIVTVAACTGQPAPTAPSQPLPAIVTALPAVVSTAASGALETAAPALETAVPQIQTEVPRLIQTPVATTLSSGVATAAAGLETAVPGALPAIQAALPTVSAAVTANWQSLRDAASGFSLSYPPGTDVTSGQGPNGVYTARLQFQVPGVTGYQGMLVRVQPNPDHKGVEQIVNQLYQDAALGETLPDMMANAQRINVAGLPALQTSGAGDFSIVVPYGDKVYILAPVHEMATNAVDPKTLELFYQVLSTLQIGK